MEILYCKSPSITLILAPSFFSIAPSSSGGSIPNEEKEHREGGAVSVLECVLLCLLKAMA